jgi:hypothetical protein
MGAHRFERHAGRRTVGLAVFAAMCCLVAAPVVASADVVNVPSIESESVSSVTSTDATLEAQVNLHEAGAGAYYQFQLVRNPSDYAPEILCPPKLPPETNGCVGTQSASALPIGFIPGNTLQPSVDHPVSLDLASAGVTLQPGTTYHYRLLVARRVQTEDTIQWEPPIVYGTDQMFTTPSGPPTIQSESASRITQTDATLEAQINPEADQAGDYAQFQLVRDPSEYPSEILCPATPHPGADGCIGAHSESALPIAWVCGSCEQEATTRPVSLDLASAGVTLQPGTTYHYRVLAARRVQTEDTIEWEPPTVYGPDRTFTTPPGSPPAIESESVSHLTPTDVTLEAQMDTEGFETTYDFYLQEAPLCLDFGCEVPEFEPLALPAGKLLGSFVAQSVSVDLNSTGVTLNPGADYRYWVTATSPAGTTRGQTQRFMAPVDGTAQPLSTTSPPGSHATSGPASNAGQGTVMPAANDSADNDGTPSPKVTASTSAKKLAKAVRACKHKPRKQRASCVKQAHNRYGTSLQHAGKQLSKRK